MSSVLPSREAAPAVQQAASAPDAFSLLVEDHRKVAALFDQFGRASEACKPQIAEKICAELTIHAILEEEIFYPEARQCLDNDAGEDLLDEAEVEHEGIKGLVDRIKQSGGHGDLFEAQVTVLKGYVEHHIKEEETEIFPKLREVRFDARDVGALLEERKKEMMERWQPVPHG
jgi:hemerythrin superfamily protein